MTSTGRLCHPVGFDGDETKVKIARSKYRTGSDGKADPNSKFPAVYHADFQWQWKLSGLEHPKIFDAALIFRFSSLHDEKRRISSLVRLLFDKLSLTLFASCFKPSTRPQKPGAMDQDGRCASNRYRIRSEAIFATRIPPRHFRWRISQRIPTQVGPGCLQRKGQTGGAVYHQYIREFSKSPFQGQSRGLVIQMDPWVPAVIRLVVW